MRGKEEEGRENIYTPLNSSGIPTLIILNENGDVITKNGRGAVMSDTEGQVILYDMYCHNHLTL